MQTGSSFMKVIAEETKETVAVAQTLPLLLLPLPLVMVVAIQLLVVETIGVTPILFVEILAPTMDLAVAEPVTQILAWDLAVEVPWVMNLQWTLL